MKDRFFLKSFFKMVVTRKWSGFVVCALSIAYFIILSSCSPKLSSSFNGNDSSTAKTVKSYVAGSILPLAGLLSLEDHSFPRNLIRSSYATACDYRQVSVNLYALDSSGNPGASPLSTVSLLDSAAHYRIEKLEAIGVDPSSVKNGVGYLLAVTGCAGNEIRAPLTSLGNFDITASMALIGMLSQGSSDLRTSLRDISPEAMSSLMRKLSASISDQSSIENAYATLSANSVLKSQFESSFGRRFTVNDLQNVQPQIISLNWPKSEINESTSTSFFVGASHWNPHYTIRYLWKIDGQIVSTSSAYIYTPGKNAQGSHVISLYVGADDGTGSLDTSLPYYFESKTIKVANSDLPTAPSFSLLGNASLVSNPNLNLTIQTGNSLENCKSFSWMAFTEDTESLPDDSMFSIQCNSNGTQTVPYLMSHLSDGIHVLRLWVKDASGVVSLTSSSTSFFLDRSPPSTTLSSGPPHATNSNEASFVFVGTDPGNGTISGYECKLDSDVFTACSSPKNLSGVSSGSHSFYFRAIDSAGNTGVASIYNWIVDQSAPTVTIGGNPNSLNNSTLATFTFSGSDTGGGDLAGFYCRLDNEAFSVCNSPKSFTALPAGTHTFSVKSFDSAGNFSSISNSTWVIDLEGPTVTISARPNNITNLSTAGFSFSASDTGGGTISGFECKLDNGVYANCSSPHSLSSLSSGAHTFTIRALDSAGNFGVSASSSWIIDQTAPIVSIESGPTTVTNATSGNFVFSATDSGGGSVSRFECKMDSGSFGACISPKNVSSLSPGAHTFYVHAIDTAGNTSTDASYSWTIDTTAPTTTISASPSGYTNSATASVSFSATDTGGSVVSSFECKIDSGAYSTCISPASFSSLLDGAHMISVRAIDSAGNTGNAATSSWIVDTVAPVIEVTVPSSVRGGQTSSVSWTLTELNSINTNNFTVEFYNGTTWSSIGSIASMSGSLSAQAFSVSSFTVPMGDSNLAKVRVSYTDRAGNSTSQTSSTFILDSTAPTISAFQLAGGSTTTALPTVTLSISSADSTVGGATSGVTQMQISEINSSSSGTWINYAASTTYTLSAANGSKTVYAWVKDAVGNISAVSTYVISLDFGNPPTVSITSPISGATYAPGDIVPIDWNCSSSQGLAAYPIPYIRYTIDDGATFFDIATDLPNNVSATTSGTYNWTLPATAPTTPTATSMTGKPFRILVGCKSAAGVVNSAFSAPLSTGGWSVYLGDPTYNLKNVNASIANVSTDTNTRSSITSDNLDNIYYRKTNAIMKIDHVTGIVTEFAGQIETTGCTLGVGYSALASGHNLMTGPNILGSSTDGTRLFVISCNIIYSIVASTGIVENSWNISSLPITGSGATQFLAGGRYLFWARTVGNAIYIYRLDLSSGSSTPLLIHGNGGDSTTASNPAVGDNPLSISPLPNPSGSAIFFMATPDGKKVWYRGTGIYRLDDPDGDGVYTVGQTGISWSPNLSDTTQCYDTRFDTKIYCASRGSGRKFGVFDPSTGNFNPVNTLPFVFNDDSGRLGLGTGVSRLLAIYSQNTIHSIDTTNLGSNSAYTLIAGQPFSTFGNGSDPTQVGFGDLFDMRYFSSLKKLYIFNRGHIRFVDTNGSSPIISTSAYASLTNGRRVTTDPSGANIFSDFDTCANGLSFQRMNVSTGTLTWMLTRSSCTTTAGFYPVSSGTSATATGQYFRVETFRTTNGNIDMDNLPVYRANGVAYFSSRSIGSGSNNVFIYSISGGNLYQIAGKAGATTYDANDSGKSALGASLVNVKVMKEIESGAYAGDLMIWDGNYMRRISIASQVAGTPCPVSGNAPCIYDVVNYGTATGFISGTTFQDAIYDPSTEINGVFGSGTTYYVSGSTVVHKFLPTAVASGMVSAATDTAYSFAGTTLSGEVRLALTPAGLLLTQPTKQRILRVAP